MAKLASQAKKTVDSYFADLEQKFVKKYVTKIPSWLETYHLTLLTILWSLGILYFSYLARNNINWLWLCSLMVLLQYFSDLFDGAVGRLRNTGLVKWGFYMDHFLDYVFMCSIIIGYSFLLPQFTYHYLILVAISAGYMINAFLRFGAIQQFNITYLKAGPTEMRAFIIILNTIIIYYGINVFADYFNHLLFLLGIVLIGIVYLEQKRIWKVDMKNK
tara:strand:+ start:11346 stop:11996 length:651 start_codon:yes stop_codon:yes gene_type:complete